LDEKDNCPHTEYALSLPEAQEALKKKDWKRKKQEPEENSYQGSVELASLSWMLNQLFGVPILATLPYVFVSEQTICLIGAYLFKAIETRYTWWQD